MRAWPGNSPAAVFLARSLYIPILAVLSLSLIQKRGGAEGRRKRLASFAVGASLVMLLGAVLLIIRFGLPDLALAPALLGLAAAWFLRRDLFFPFRRRCRGCGNLLGWETILFHDSDLCPSCRGR